IEISNYPSLPVCRPQPQKGPWDWGTPYNRSPQQLASPVPPPELLRLATHPEYSEPAALPGALNFRISQTPTPAYDVTAGAGAPGPSGSQTGTGRPVPLLFIFVRYSGPTPGSRFRQRASMQ